MFLIVDNFNLFEFSAAILEKDLVSSLQRFIVLKVILGSSALALKASWISRPKKDPDVFYQHKGSYKYTKKVGPS